MPHPSLDLRRTQVDPEPCRRVARRVEILEEKVDAFAAVPDRLTSLESGVAMLSDDLKSFRAELRAEIRAGDEETRRQMRVLHEDVISRIALLQEGIDRRNGRAAARAAPKPPRRRR